MRVSLIDLASSFKRMPFILHMAIGDTRARYKRSFLGPLWLTIGAAIGVVGLGLVWSVLLNQPKSELIPSLSVGLLLWQFIAGCVNESCSVFVRQANIIRNIKLPFFIHPIQLLTRNFIGFIHNAIIIVVVFTIYPPPITAFTPMAIVGLILVLANLLWIIMLLGMLGARFRDLELIVHAFMPIVFFLTPVIFKVGHSDLNQSIIWLNPFTYLMSVVRDPLFGNLPPSSVYIVVLAMLFFGWTLTMIILNKCSIRIPFWI